MKLKLHLFSLLCFLMMGFSNELLSQDPVGKWKFDVAGNLILAEIGSDLELVGSAVAIPGPGESNGAVRIGLGSYFNMTHGIAPNGGGAYVNEWSLQVDFRVASLGSWYTFFQTNPANSNDGDCFINTSGNIGVGSTGYSASAIEAGKWYRLVISVQNGIFYRYYLDGLLIKEGAVQSLDGRFALENLLLMFADNDGDDNEIDCAELAIWDMPLSESEVAKLGGFSGKKGWWAFDNQDNLVYAHVGSELELVGSHLAIEGPDSTNGAVQIGVGSHYKMRHGMSANGEGNFVNEWSLLIDFRISQLEVWHTFFQTDISNTSDGDCFKNTSGNIGVFVTGYSTRAIEINQWYRLIISVDLGSHYNYYLEGSLLRQGTSQSIDGRFALDSLLLLFADEDGEDNLIDVAQVAIWDLALTAQQAQEFGGFNPDTTAPAAPTNLYVLRDVYLNLVTWMDTPDEAGETYSVYYSEDPITDVNAPEVGVVEMGMGVSENGGLLSHLLFSPVSDSTVNFYYAVSTTDYSGNVGAPAVLASPVTNTAKGIPTIVLTPPATFAADGNLSEWSAIPPFRLFPSEGAHIVTNTTISNDDDCSGLMYLAADAAYLYFAFDVTDDILDYSSSTSYMQDSPDLFLGFYDYRGKPHNGYVTGADPDYHFRLNHDQLIIDNRSSAVLVSAGADYYWDAKFPVGYIIEGKFSWADLAAVTGDSVFTPVEGYRIPFNFLFNDSDAPDSREGILTWSLYDDDTAWRSPVYWLYTWLGTTDSPVLSIGDGLQTPQIYSLSQNYPNPFNPVTTINYSLAKSGKVTIEIFNVLGQKVWTLFDKFQQAGEYTVSFDAAKLSTGIYFYQINSGEFEMTRKMVLIR